MSNVSAVQFAISLTHTLLEVWTLQFFPLLIVVSLKNIASTRKEKQATDVLAALGWSSVRRDRRHCGRNRQVQGTPATRRNTNLPPRTSFSSSLDSRCIALTTHCRQALPHRVRSKSKHSREVLKALLWQVTMHDKCFSSLLASSCSDKITQRQPKEGMICLVHGLRRLQPCPSIA